MRSPAVTVCYNVSLVSVYLSKYSPTPSTAHAMVIKAARAEYHKIQKLSPRREAYVRSKYFRRDKVFINQFWEHLKQKRPGDVVRRARLFVPAIDLIRNTTISPETIYSQEDKDMELHRFYGTTRSGVDFVVQIRESKRSKRKDFMSVFPAVNKNTK